MGVLYAKVAGNWVPINISGDGGESGGGSLAPPAEAGPRADAVTQARFGNVDEASKRVGFFATPAGGNLVIAAHGDSFTVWDRTADGSSYRGIATFLLNDSTIHPWRLTTVPHGGPTLMPAGNGGSTDYTLLSVSGNTYLNASAGCGLNFRIGNGNTVASSDAGTFTINNTLSCQNITTPATIWCGALSNSGSMWSANLTTGPITCGTVNGSTISGTTVNASSNFAGPTFNANRGNQGGDWSTSHFTAYNGAGDYHGARVGFFASGAASQWWLAYPNGGALCAMNNANSATTHVIASAFNVGSALAVKKDVRTLRPERERITVQRDPASDLVAQPDIMALRPVAFRPRTLMQLHGEDYPADTVLGRETRRERLGLIADEVQHVIPSSVIHTTDNEVVGIDYAQITVALLDHVQELTRTVETLQYRIAELEGQP